MVGVAVVVVCVLLNIAGVRSFPTLRCGSSWRLSAPFASGPDLGAVQVSRPGEYRHDADDVEVDIIGGLLICMWNYMGWDNASTIATEVENPQRTYPRAMLWSVFIIALSYIAPVAGGLDDRPSRRCLGNRLLGRHCRTAGRPWLEGRSGGRRNGQRLRNV